jgi:23S rRNA-intervening sequence protein
MKRPKAFGRCWNGPENVDATTILAMQENILNKIYDFWKTFFPLSGKFPKQYKFVLGDRMQNLSSELMELSVEAYFTPGNQEAKRALLQKANLKVELMRRYLRLCSDLRLLSLSNVERLQRSVDEIGRMLGGWIKSLK